LSRLITRRFGFAGGLAFVALLASTEGYEIVKKLLEREYEGDGELVELPSGLTYRDQKVGGGPNPRVGDFVGAHFQVSVNGEEVLDTYRSKPIAFTYGKKPYASVVCPGVEEGMSTMRRGGIREIIVPPELAYGSKERELPGGVVVPAGAGVTMVVTLVDVTGGYL